MSTIRWSAALVASGLLVGCANNSHKNQAPPPPPAAPSMTLSLEQARSQLHAANPLATVGVVTAVHADQGLLAVRNMPSENLSVDDPVSITTNDSSMRQIVLGQVKKVEPNLVIVQFDSHQGVPTSGEFAVRAPLPPGAPMRDETGTGAGNAPDATQSPAPATGGATNPPATGTDNVPP
ncbi:MAG TPA: hypothetical protein VFC78_02250, partial [Tepidisphaeraceae bacterium]|nr:hypothetical protein [Tepidisphaeraceae bacterium]